MSNTATIAGFTQTEIDEIMTSAAEVDAQVDAIHAHLDATGTVVPMRTLGWGEEIVLNQRHQIVQAQMERAEKLMSEWTAPDQDDSSDDDEIVSNVQVDIVNLDTGDAVNLAADVARQAMIDVGMPVGPTTPVDLGVFEGSYLVDLPRDWYIELVESGEDYWSETGNVAVTIAFP